MLPEGQTSACARCRPARGDLRARRPRAVPVDRRHGRRHGARGRRRGGRGLRARRAPASSSPPARCAGPTRSSAWAARTPSPRWPTAPRRCRRSDVIVGPGNLYVQEAKRQVAAAVGHRRLRRAVATWSCWPTAGADPGLVALDLLAQAEHGEGRSSARSATTPTCSTRARLADSPAPAAAALVDAPDLEAALAFAEAFAPEHLRADRRGAEALAPRVRAPAAVFVGRDSGDGVRGLRRRLQPHAADRRRRARFASGLGPRHFRRRMAEVRIGPGRGGAGPRRRADRRAPRASRRHAASMEAGSGESGVVSRTAEIAAQDRGDRRRARARPRRHRRGHAARPASGSSTTCSTCWRATAASTSRSGPRRPRDRRAPHRRGHGHRPRPGARRGAGRPRAASRATAARCVPMDEARARVALDLSRAARTAPSRSTLPAGRYRRLRARAAEEFFRAVGQRRAADPPRRAEAGDNAHHMIEACFKALARALREAVAVDPASRACPRPRARCGDHRIAHRRLRDGQPAQRREGARRTSARARVIRATTTRPCAPTRLVAARRRRVRRGDARAGASAASTTSCASAAEAGVPRARHLPGDAAAVRATTEHGGVEGLGLLPGPGRARCERAAQAPAHRLEPVALTRRAAPGSTACEAGGLLLRALVRAGRPTSATWSARATTACPSPRSWRAGRHGRAVPPREVLRRGRRCSPTSLGARAGAP